MGRLRLGFAMSTLSRLLAQQPEPKQQGSSLSDIFEVEPVSLDEFVTGKQYMNNPPLSPIQYDAVRHIEQIYFPETYQQMVSEFGPYWQPKRRINLATLQWGKGAGKDSCARVASLRIAYLLICLKSPQAYFGMPGQDSIHILNVASNRSQAYRAFFKPLKRLVTTVPWFKEHCEPVGPDMVVWDKSVEMISGHADAESQEGLNLMLGIADEIDAFRSKEELMAFKGNRVREPTKSAEAILKMMRTSASTRFPESYKIVTISYPRYLGSTIQRLTAAAKADIAKHGDNSREYVSGPYATWEVNPRVKGKEQFAKDYDEDPVMAQTMYECKPVRATDPYFRNEQAVASVFREASEPVAVSYDQEAVNGVWSPAYAWSDALVPMQGAQYCIHADLAVTGDRAGVAMSHVQTWNEFQVQELGEDGEVRTYSEYRPVVKVDFVFGYEADLRTSPPREIQIRWVRQLVADLRKRGFVISKVSYDAFQSRDSMQILEAAGIETQKVSLDSSEEGWRTLRDLIYEGRISLPESALLREEILGLRKLPNGRVDHPHSGSKDLADAVAGSVLGALGVGGQETGQRSFGDAGQIEVVGSQEVSAFGQKAAQGLDVPIMFR